MRELKRVFCRKRTWLLALLPVAALLLWTAQNNAVFAEKLYARGIFRVLSVALSNLTGWLPFSLAEVTIVLGPLLLAAVVIRYLYRLVTRKEERFFRCFNGILHVLCTISVVFFCYVIGCGINYYRYPVSAYLGLTVQDSSEEELAGLLKELAQTASGLREELAEDDNGVYCLPMSHRELGLQAKKAYEQLSKQYEVFSGQYPAPKRVLLSRLMSYTQITGIYTCWTMEANVNVDISPYSIASTMCHELAHLRGFIREDEANYISYLACMASASFDVQYSGAMHALIHTGNALYRKNPEAYFEIYRTCYSEAVIRDLAANSAYWKQFEKTKVAETSEKINDSYLKANHQVDGTQSYGRVVDLLLAAYRKRQETEIEGLSKDS